MILKWIFDRLMALVGLMMLWPVLLVVAILVRVKMPGGPAFFCQKRVGKNGKLFTCHILNHTSLQFLRFWIRLSGTTNHPREHRSHNSQYLFTNFRERKQGIVFVVLRQSKKISDVIFNGEFLHFSHFHIFTHLCGLITVNLTQSQMPTERK